MASLFNIGVNLNDSWRDGNLQTKKNSFPQANPYHTPFPDWLEDGYDFDNWTAPFHFQDNGFVVPGRWIDLNTHMNLTADGPDFYAFDAKAGDSVRVTVCGEEGAEITLQWINSTDGTINRASTIEYAGSFGFCSLDLYTEIEREFIICVNASGLWDDQYNLEILVNGNAGYIYRSGNPYAGQATQPDWLEDGYDFDNSTSPFHFQDADFVVPGRWNGLNLHKNLTFDYPDYYAFDAKAGENIKILLFTEIDCDIQIQIVTHTGNVLKTSSTPHYGVDSVEIDVDSDQTVIFCVNTSTGEWQHFYDMAITINNNIGYEYNSGNPYAGQATQPDWLEDGFDFDNSTSPFHFQDNGFVVPGRWNGLNLHKNLTFDYPDYYAFDAKAGDNIKILLFTEIDCDIQIQIVTHTGNVLKTSSTPHYGVDSVEIDVDSDQTVIFCVNTSTGEWQHFYDMAITINNNIGYEYNSGNPYAGQATQPDWLEDGFDFDNSTSPFHFQDNGFVVPGRWNGLNLHKNLTFDYPDYYAFDAKAGDNIKILLFTEIDCDIQIQIVTHTGNVLKTSSTPHYGVDSVEIDVDSDQTVIFCVNTSTGEWQHFYDMAITINNNIGHENIIEFINEPVDDTTDDDTTDDDTTDDDTTDDDTTDDDTTDDTTTDDDTTDDDTTDDTTTDDTTTDDDTTDNSTNDDNPNFNIPGFMPLGLIMVSVFTFVLIGKRMKEVKMK